MKKITGTYLQGISSVYQPEFPDLNFLTKAPFAVSLFVRSSSLPFSIYSRALSYIYLIVTSPGSVLFRLLARVAFSNHFFFFIKSAHTARKYSAISCFKKQALYTYLRKISGNRNDFEAVDLDSQLR